MMNSSDSVQQQASGMEVVYMGSIKNSISTSISTTGSTNTKAVILTNESNTEDKNNDNHSIHDKLSYWIQMESYFFNHGAEWAIWTFWMALNVIFGAWGAWLYTAPTYTTMSNVLRITLPIARASGRIVTLNISFLFLSACKFFITWIRANTIIPYGFPIDNIMPTYHRMIAYVIIVMGCLIHTAPQVYNYASQTLAINGNVPIWSFGQGLSTRSLLYTGIILWLTFVMFSLSTLESFRRTTTGFRWFWGLHLTGIVFVIPNILIHGTYMGTPITFYFMILPLIMYLFDFYLRRIYNVSRECKLISMIPHAEERVTELHVQLSPFPYTPGQYAEINIPELAKYEWHPFTIASAPTLDIADITTSSSIDNKKAIDSVVNLTFYIKASGRWTNALYDIAVKHKTEGRRDIVRIPLSVSIRGPFGAPAQNYFLYKHIVVIGSGIGVTPLLSIWKYLVNQAALLTVKDDLEYPPISSSFRTSQRSAASKIVDEEWEEKHILNDFNLNYVGIQNFTHLSSSISKKSITKNPTNHVAASTNHQHHHNHHRVIFAYYASILESMTVNICFFCFTMILETIVYCVWMFGKEHEAAILQTLAASIVLFMFGGKIIFSIIAYGKRYYVHSIVFKLDMGIVILKSLDFLFAILSATEDPPNTAMARANFTFYMFYMVLHLIRIFHIYYSTARPPVVEEQHEADHSGNDNKSVGTAGGTLSTIRSVTGIWVSQKFSSMSYAAPDLIKDCLTLSDKFALYLYATRDKQSDLDNGIGDIEGSIDLDASLGGCHTKKSQQQQNNKNYRLIGGRPDWEQLFMDIIDSVHDDSPDGEAIGVFFCGAPAIACALQNAAYRINAQHRHITNNQCRCRILIHKENF